MKDDSGMVVFEKDWKTKLGEWIYNLVKVVISGVGSVIALMVADPTHAADYRVLRSIVVTQMLITAAGYIRSVSLPDIFKKSKEKSDV